MKNPYAVLKHLHVTEKTQMMQANASHKYAFTVVPSTTKIEIKQAIEMLYPSVKVVKVNTVVRATKTKRVGKSKPGTTRQLKTAYITLQAGDQLD